MTGQNPDRDFGTGIDKSISQEITVEILDSNHISVCKITVYRINFIVINPHTAGFQRAALAFFQSDNRVFCHRRFLSKFV